MNVLILHSQIPFERGGTEVLVEGLRDALIERGHNAEIVGVPLSWYPPGNLLRSTLAWRIVELGSSNGRPVDLVVCTKFPTWAASHPNKVLWLVHQHRQAYDLYGSPMTNFGPGDTPIREAVLSIDRIGIGECVRRFAISRNVADRLQRYNGIGADVLYPPVERELWPEAYEPFIFSPARMDPLKRLDHLLRAWPHVDDSLCLRLASDGFQRPHLESLARSLGIEHRVEFLGRVSDEELERLFRTCRAVYYAPVDEDYGYVTVEAHRAGKPVITSHDSGGVLEFVQHQASGLVTTLDPESLAGTVNRYASEQLAREHGMCGRSSTRGTTWDDVVGALLGSSTT